MSYLEHLPPPRVVPRGQHVLFDLLRQRERLRLRTSAKQRSAAQRSVPQCAQRCQAAMIGRTGERTATMALTVLQQYTAVTHPVAGVAV
jgi:hypothetical protein